MRRHWAGGRQLVLWAALAGVLGVAFAARAGEGGPAPADADASASPTVGAPATGAPNRMQSLKDRAEPTPLSSRLGALLGLGVMVLLAYGLSRNRRAIRWRIVAWGIALQLVFGAAVLSPRVGGFFFEVVDVSVNKLLSFSQAGSEFLFKGVVPHDITLVDPVTGKRTTDTVVGKMSPPLKTIAFWVLPTIIFFSALMTVLYHLGWMQKLVRATAWLMQRTMGTSGSESLSAAGNIFVGQTEAPLLVKPYVATMTNSELHAMMVGGFATVAGGVLAVYVGVLKTQIPDIAGHLVMASIMSAPAALAIAKILYPETEPSQTAGRVQLDVGRPDVNVIEALTRGAREGMILTVNVAAMLLAFVAMVALLNGVLAGVSLLLAKVGLGVSLSLEGILAWLFAPLAWCMGVPWSECMVVGRLLGEKLVLTELIAYLNLGDILNGPRPLSYRTAVITSYALCGFANFASIGIQIGGIGGIAPERYKDLARLGLLAMIGGTLAAMMTGTVAGIIL